MPKDKEERLAFPKPQSDQDAYQLEKKHVNDIYNVISSHFDSTRYKAWPLVEKFINDLGYGAIGIDVGCGNGKYIHLNKEKIYMIGSDISPSFTTICKDKNLEVLTADNLYLPYKDNSFDFAISIAVIHHFSTFERRVMALRETIRVMKPGATFLVTAWAMTQKWKGKNYDQQDVMVPWVFQNRFSNDTNNQSNNNNNNNNNNNDNENNNNNKKNENSQLFHRYYHLFDDGEFESLFKEIDNVEILSNNLDHDNYYCIIKKKKKEENTAETQ